MAKTKTLDEVVTGQLQKIEQLENSINEMQQLEIPNMPQPEKRYYSNNIYIEEILYKSKSMYVIRVESKEPEVHLIAQKLQALLNKLGKLNVFVNIENLPF